MGETPSVNQSEASILNSDPAHLAYLLGQQRRMEFAGPRGHYPAAATRPQRKPHTFSEAQRESFEFLKNCIKELSEGFTANELKKAFRSAAMILHPDKGGSTDQFLALKKHYEQLRMVVVK